jgi:hypothetical protein
LQKGTFTLFWEHIYGRLLVGNILHMSTAVTGGRPLPASFC